MGIIDHVPQRYHLFYTESLIVLPFICRGTTFEIETAIQTFKDLRIFFGAMHAINCCFSSMEKISFLVVTKL